LHAVAQDIAMKRYKLC